MPNYICQTCGTQFAATQSQPEHCPICEDDRQYIGWEGQQWTTLETLQTSRHNTIKNLEPGLIGIGTEPAFAIGQRALLVQTPQGNLLWDCISLLDEETIHKVNSYGGIDAIAISHPHYYSSMVEWSHAFNAPIYLHASDQKWVMRPGDAVHFWDGDRYPLFGGLSLIRCGGHFPGGTVLYWPEGAGGRGVLLTGDIINVVSDRRYVSFMYSFPNLIPLPPSQIHQIVMAVEDLSFDRIYGAWWGRMVEQDAKEAVKRSAERYIRAITDTHTSVTPYLAIKGADKAIEFYKNAFGAVEVARLTDPQGKITHAEIRVGDRPIFISDEWPDSQALSPETIGGSPVMIVLDVPDVDTLFKQAAAAGAEISRPPQDFFGGSLRTAKINDPFGHRWMITTSRNPSKLQAELNHKFV